MNNVAETIIAVKTLSGSVSFKLRLKSSDYYHEPTSTLMFNDKRYAEIVYFSNMFGISTSEDV